MKFKSCEFEENLFQTNEFNDRTKERNLNQMNLMTRLRSEIVWI